jgi:tetratricopeptide (TPR) repeat protein
VSDESGRKREATTRRQPLDADGWYEVGVSALQANEVGQAREAFARAVELAPNHPAIRPLAELLEQSGDVAGAIACWRRAVDLSGHQDLEALTALGIALSTNAEHPEAVQILWDVAQRQGTVSAAHADLGMALLAGQRLDEALAAFTRARQLEPESAQAHCGLGLVLQQQGRWWEAADAFKRTEQLAPDSPVGATNLSAVLETLGEHQQARAALQRAVALAPDDQELRAALEQLAVPQAVQDEITRPALRADQFEASIAGDLKTFQLLDVLEFLRLQNKSGSLVVSSRHGAGVMRLVRGRITSAAAPGVKRLGEALVEQNVIVGEQLERALAQQRDDQEEALGTLLLRDGALDSAQLADVVLRQVMAALDEMLGWTEGAFSFHGAEDDEPPPISFHLQEVTLKVLKVRDERQAAPHT